MPMKETTAKPGEVLQSASGGNEIHGRDQPGRSEGIGAGGSGKAGKRGESPPGKKKKKSSAGNDLLLLGFKVIIVGLFLGFMYLFFFGVTQVRDNSMSPALREGDLVIYYRLGKDYQKDDLITVEVNGVMQARRVVAVAGDTVDINENGLVINGYSQIESNIYTSTEPYTEGISFPVTVADGQVFVLADNRTGAQDSRIYGCVEKSATGGRAMAVIRRRGF